MTVTTLYHNPHVPMSDNVARYSDRDDDLRRRQREHLDRVQRQTMGAAADCMHNQCSECIGTGVRRDGTPCVHSISCPCRRCTPWL